MIQHEPKHDLIVEQLANCQHKIWAHWMQYLFSVSPTNADNSVTIPAAKVERWHRQMKTGFDDLPEQERSSDLNMAEWAMEAIEPTISGQRNEIAFWQEKVTELRHEIEALKAQLDAVPMAAIKTAFDTSTMAEWGNDDWNAQSDALGAWLREVTK
jgi:hypothetical protein